MTSVSSPNFASRSLCSPWWMWTMAPERQSLRPLTSDAPKTCSCGCRHGRKALLGNSLLPGIWELSPCYAPGGWLLQPIWVRDIRWDRIKKRSMEDVGKTSRAIGVRSRIEAEENEWGPEVGWRGKWLINLWGLWIAEKSKWGLWRRGWVGLFMVLRASKMFGTELSLGCGENGGWWVGQGKQDGGRISAQSRVGEDFSCPCPLH